MPDIKNNIKVIYNALAKEGYNDLGSEQEFAESMADENNRKLVYNTLKGKEFADVKDYDSFSNMVYQQPRAGQQQEEEMKPVEPAKIDPRFVAPNVGKPTDAQPIMKSVQQDTGFSAPQDYNSQNAFLSNVDKDYNVASHIPDAQQPIKMYGADSNLGEVIDNLYTVYDEAYKKDNPKKIAEAANMARSMGLDNEQAEKALTLVHGLYSQNVANNIADYMYSRMNNGDPLYALKEVYYNKDFQKKLKDTTTRLGLDNTQGFVEYYLKPALQRKLENERGFTDTVNFGVQSGSDDVAKNTEVFEKRKAEEDLLQKQVDAMNAEGKRIEEKGQQMYDPNYKDRPWWADLIPVEGGGRSAYDEAEGIKRNPEAEELMRTGQAMQRMSDDAQAAISEDNILRTRKTDGLTNQIKNAFGRILRGGAKTATDIRTWDFGFTDLKDATVIKAAADAYANNRATAAQKALLNGVALKNAVMGKHGDSLGGLYGAAGTTIQMVPFMAQFAFSPVKGVGPAAQKYCRTQLEKAFGKYATEAVGKFVIKSGELAGRFAGDVAQGAAMTTIFNMPAVAADTHKRMTGDLEAATDSKGNIVYSGKRTNVKSGGRAFAEAFTAQTIENQSELVGEYFAPLQDFIQKGAIKALDKWGLSKTKDFLTGINNKQIMKSFNRFTKNTEWNGLFGEVGEEIVGNFENAFTVGDLNLNLDINDDNSVFSKKVNTDIILGVGLGCGIISGARVGSYIRNNRKLNTAINDADTHADVIFGTDRWQQIKSEIDNAPDDKAGNLLQSYINNAKLNNEQKQTIVDYTVNTYIKRGNDISHLKNAIEDNISSEQQEVQSAYENGQNARDAQMNEVKTSLDEAEKHAAELLGEDELNALDGIEDIDAFKESNAYKSYSEEQREAALKYTIARTAYNGMINRVQDEIKAAVNKANAEIDNLTHKDSGTIIRATLKNGDQEVYVVSGNVVMSPDGKSIDTEKSDSDIVVYNTESGKKEMLNIKDLQSVDTPIDAATYKANNAAETTQQIAETEAAKIDGTRSFHYNDTVKVQDKEGNLIDGSVQDVTPDGIIVVSDAYPGGKTYTAAELTAMQPQPQTVAENATVEQQAEEAVADNESNEAPAEEKGEANSPQSEATPQEETAEPQQQAVEPQQQAIPTDDKGSLLYHEVPVERTIEDLYDGSLDDTEITDFISANIEAAQKEYNSVVKKAPKIGTDKARYLQEKKAYQEEVDKAKAKVDYWQAVENERQRITHTSPEELKNAEDELSGEAAQSLITSMEENAIEDPEIRLTPQTWLETFGINNSIDTPIGKVRMGENQYAKLQDKKRTSEFGMISLTLSDPDVIFVEPSKAKGEDVAERNFSYVFAKTFKRNGNKVKYYTSVTVSIDGLEISVSSHFVNPNKMLNKLMEFNREYTKETLFSNSSEMRLAEHQSDVPDLLPTQENNVSSDSKVTQSSQTKQEKENKFSPTPRKEEEAKVDTNPTEAQKEAGNYRKGHIKVDGLDITIEQPKGSIRRGTDANGKQWESEMHNTYGYIRGTESVDGDHIDIFLSDNPTEGNVFVVDQINKDGSFDEHKVMYGFSDMESARQAYLSNYEEGWQGLGNITEVSKEDFKAWIDSSKRKTKPFAEYTSVKTQGDVQAKKPTEIPHLTEKEKREQRKQELRNKIKVKLRGQLNVGVDPELFMMGVELASMEIEDGVRKFADFTKKMIAEIGDEIRPYLKSIYNGARDLPGMEELSEEMTPYEEVKAFNIATIGDKGEEVKPSVLDTAEQINNEQTVERSAKEEVKNTVETQDVDNEAYSITKQHNNKKDIDIWVVRGKERTDSDAFKERKQVAKKYNGYYSSFRGVNGFVFNSPEDAQSFADKVFDAKDEQINTETNENYAHNSNEIIRKDEDGDASNLLTDSHNEKEQSEKEAELHGLKVGDKVLYKGKEATIFDFDNGRPVLDTGLAPVVYEVVDMEAVKPIEKQEQTKTNVKEDLTEEKTEAKAKEANNKTVSSHAEGNLFDTDTAPTESLTNKEKENEVHLSTGETATKRERGHEPRQNEPMGESKQNEAQRPDGRRMDRRDTAHISTDTERGGGVPNVSKGKQRLNSNNNHGERGVDYAPTSIDARIEANIQAIELAKKLTENGEKATPQQMEILRKFSGWGGLGKAFNENPNGAYGEINKTPRILKELLGEEAYNNAIESANSSYYTPTHIIDTLWDIAENLGFKGGRILEGSAGIGNIIAQIPTHINENSNIHAVEKDPTAGSILSLLYPDAKVDIQGFEETSIPNGSIDLAITNVPFVTGLRVWDTTSDKDLSKKFHDIHNFCIAKNIRKLREGGTGIFISSNGTLDNSQQIRNWVVNDGNADFIGAFRLNNKTFLGTSVTSDIIVVRKRVDGKKSAKAIDVSEVSGERIAEFNTGEVKNVKGKMIPVIKDLPMDYNKYFIEHPEKMAGVMEFAFEHGDTYRPTTKQLYPTKDKPQDKLLEEFVNSLSIDTEEQAQNVDNEQGINNSIYEELGSDVKEGSMVVSNGELCVAQYGQAVPLKLNANKVKGHTKQECFKSYTDIKQALNDVLAYETQNADDKGLQPLLDKLNKAYDDFVNTYGHLNKNTSISFLRNDIDFSNILALETYKEENDENNNRVKVYGKTDVFSKRVVTKETEPKPDNVKDGVIVSIYKNGRIDIPYISKQLNMSEDAVKDEIINSGLGFENPVSKEIEVSYKYLSGNVREKLQQAEENNENSEYSNNINALKKVIPANIPAHLIEFNLGSSWVTPKLYEEYIKNKTGLDVTLIPVDGTWVMKAPLYGLAIEQNRSMGVYSKLKGETILGHELIEAAIQNKTITISKTRKDWDGKKETIVDKDATQACNSRIDEIRQDFKDWARGKVQSDVELSQELEKIYNDKFNNYVAPTIPEEFIPERFGGAAQNIKLRPHQAQAVVRGTTQPLILAHEVGTGKTFTLISTAMEMRRLGTARKPMIVVQNATVGQFVASAKALYPNAKILTLENSDRGEDGRRRFYAKIRYNDWDMIVVPQSTFEFIPDSKDRQITFIKDKVDEKLAVLQRMKEANDKGDDFITRRVEKEIAQLQSEIAALIENNESEQREKKATASELKKKEVTKKNTEAKAKEMLDRRTDDVEDFDELGIDALLVDEAHEYKHLGFATAMQRGVKGVDPSYSKKAQSVFLKTQAVLSKNNGRNVIFATGTPISNTAAEIWTFMRYLMPADTMKEYGIYYFDDFVRNFGNIQQMLEFTTSGKFKENNRFAGYINLPELARIWSSVADIVLTRDQKKLKEKIPEIEGGKAQDIYLPQTKSLRSVMKYVKDQLTIFENMSGAEKKENTHIPLTMYGIAKAAAVDARLVDATAEDDVNSKTNEAVRQTLQSLKDTNSYKGTVAIFADVYQNKAFGFNLYEDIKKKLIEKGVPEKEIFVMKPGMTINKKLEIFNKVNSGEIRVILGSTFTLGTGVNIQERLHTLIHLDAPNRPMDYTQRNGRILRQGNIHKEMNKPVRILRFGVEDSLDVTAYQRLKTKGAIADSIMNSKQLIENSMENRELEEEADLFGDTVAQLSGSEYAMFKNQAEKEVRKYESKKRQWEADQTYIHNAKPRLKGQISKAEQLLEDNNASLKAIKETFPNGKFKQITIGKQQFDSIEAMADFIKDYNKKINEESNKLKEKANANYNSQMVVNIDGLEFTIHLELAKETANKGVSLFSEVTRKMYYSQNELGLKNVPIKQGLLRNGIEDILKNVITGHDFAERINTLKQNITRYKSDLELILARDGKPFEFKNELETAKQKLEEYTEAMKKELEEKEKKYAAMDSEIKTATNIIGAEEAEDEDSTESKDTKDDILYRTVFGGNSGYVGYSMSKRAAEAKEEGRYPKTEFRREYHITAKSLDMLTSLGFIDNSEWHHTSMYGNKTPFYGWAEDELADDYLKHKKEIDTLCKGIDPKTKQPLIEKVEKPQYEYKFELPQYNEAATAANPIIEWRHKQIEKYDQFTGFKGYAYETKEKKKERDAFLHSLNEQMEEKIREMLAKDFPDYLAAKNAIEAYNNYEEDLRKAIGEHIKEYLDIDKYSQRWREQTATTQPTANTETLTNHAESVVQNLHLNNVEIVPDGSSLNGEQATAKGFYNKRTGKIVVVVSNHTDIADIEKTVLHEAVAHHGLRELFGDNFDNFLDTVFAKADIETRQQIAHLSAKHGWNIRTATEEYLASMAEDTNFEQIKPTLWQRIKQLFGEIMSAFGLHHANITDNDLRYILWRSYKNLQSSGKHSILDKVEDIAMQYRLKAGNYADKATDNVLYRSGIDPTATEVLPDARTRYEKETKEPDNIDSVPKTHNFFRRFYKSYVDSMLALKSFTNSVLEATGDKMASHEDTYKAENAMTSKNKTDGEVYNRDYYNPLLTAAQQLCEAVGMDYDALNMYMVAKHGLERNEYMGKRAAQNDENVLKAKKTLEDAQVAYNENPTSKNEAAIQKAQEKYSKVYDKALEVHTSRDYSGLTELTGKEDVAEAEYEAQKIVDAVETPDAMPKVTAFWSKVNAATKQTLKTGYESGIMTKDTYEHILNMYKYYIPLRGWAEPTADDVYTYYNNRSYERKPLTKTAKGRTSLAEDPMAIIASMAQRSIIEANRNKMKQTFLNFVLNHPTSLATVGEQWYIKNALGEWERSDANIPANATPDEISKLVAEHEQEMQTLAETGEAIKQRNGLKLDKRVINGEGAEHTIKVWRGGKEYIIYINGNPAVAQAVNGLTNPDTQGSDLPKWAKIGAAQLKNFLSGVYTSFSPAFVLTNFTRDQLFASQAVYIKYGLKYKRQASKNARNLFFSGALPRLVYKWEHGTLDLNNETERYFDEFMRGGGETGFTALRDIESIKKEVKDAINGNKANIAKRGWKSFINAVEFANRSAEDFSRFVTFMTSRQQGKNIVDSIYDAKDITVNFNKKGSGEMGSRFMNFAYIFFNAAVQSINNFGTMLKQHPARTMLIISKFGALGFGVPMLNAFLTALCGGGDDDKYWDNMDWVRRNNIVLRIPFLEKTFISIPLPQELRPFYGMGEIAASILFGKETFSSGLQKAVEGFTGLLPIDFTGNGGNLPITLTPTVLQPVAQYMFNTDYFGRKVYNDNENKKFAPGWTKAFSSTPPVLIEATKFLNSLTGGNDVDSGGVNLNPDVINHFVKGYFGGLATFVTQMSSLLYKGFSGDAKEIRWRDVPVASRFVQQLDERSVRSSAQGSYKDFKEETEETEYRLSNYKKQVKMGKMEYAKMITDLIKSPEYQRYKIAKAYKKPMDLLKEALNHIDNTTDKKEVEKALTGLRHYMMETVESEQKGKHAKREEDFNYLGDNLSELNNNLKSSLRSLKRNEEQRLDGEEDDGIEELISEDKETTMRIIREMNKLFKKK